MSLRKHWVLLAALPAGAQLVHLLLIVFGRLLYPIDIEWMEGGVLTMASRMQHGLPVYAAPEVGYVPFPYPFFYPLVLAGLGSVFGLDYALGRIVSVCSWSIATVLLSREAARSVDRWAAGFALGLLTAGLVASGFPVVDGWYDLVRVDSLAMLLIVVPAVLVTAPDLTRRRMWGSAVCLALSACTKQTVAPFVVAVVAYALWRHKRRGAWHAGLALGCFALLFGGAELLSQGQYSFYTLTIMAEHRLDPPRITLGLKMLLAWAPYAPLLLVATGWMAWKRTVEPRTLLFGALSLLGWLFGALGMAKDGAHVNSLMPAVMFTPAWLTMAMGGWLSRGPGREAFRNKSCPVLLIACGALCAWLWYPAAPQELPRGHWAHARAVDDYVRSLEGRVQATTIPFVAARAGKGFDQLHLQSLGDLKWAKLPYLERYSNFLNRTGPDYVIASGRETGVELLYERYALLDELEPEKYGVTTIVGWQDRPRWLLGRPGPTPRARVLFDFEGRLEGWKVRNMRATRRPEHHQGPLWGARGRALNSFHPRLGDRARGSALSPEFTIDRDCMRLYVGGGRGPQTRVELLVAGQPVFEASGLEHDALRLVDWKVKAYRGQRARLRVLDATRERWGFITLDNVVLHDGCD